MPRRDEVTAFMAALEHSRKDEIEALRAVVRGADPRIREGIKWNAPSFHTSEHFATFKLGPGDTVQLVFHTGAKAKAAPTPMRTRVDDPDGLLRWAAPDRGVVTFAGMQDVEARRDALAALVRQWLEHARL